MIKATRGNQITAAALCALTLICATFVTMAVEPVPLFTGNNSYVELGTPDALQIPSNKPFTVEGWMLFNSFSIRDMLYCKNNGRGSPYTYMLGFADGNLAAYNTVWQGNFAVVRETNRWYHVAFSFDGSNMAFYLDGNLLGTTAFSFNNNTAHTAKIGGFNTAADINGAISDVRVWDHARDQGTIQVYMGRRLSGVEPGLLGYWPLNEGTGADALDTTLHNNDGTIISATWGSDTNFSLAPPVVGFLLNKPFNLANIETGSTEFTNSNEVNVATFPIPGGYNHYQVTLADTTDAVDPDAWISTNALPAKLSFPHPVSDTHAVLYAWFTNTSESVSLRRSEGTIRFTTAVPVPAVQESFTREWVPGSPARIYPADIDTGTTGGETGGEAIPVHTLSLNLISGPDSDATPDEPIVTVSALGTYTVALVVMNAAGNVATSSVCTVTVVSYTSTPFVWIGDTDGSWHDPENWSLRAVPIAGADVVMNTGAKVTLSAASAALASYTQNGGTLTFVNWDTRLTATEVILNNGTITTAGPFNSYTNIYWPEWIPSNRVAISCRTLTLASGATIDVSGQGYLAGYYDASIGGAFIVGHGPGGGLRGQGGAHAARGGGNGPAPYGEPVYPSQAGSGGGAEYHLRDGNLAQGLGHGGGVVEILAGEAVTVNGTILADGMDTAYLSGCGAGGSILITCSAISGSGRLSAEGGQSFLHRSAYAGAGSGGRIAIHYDPIAQRETPAAGLTLSATSRRSASRVYFSTANSEPGTLYLPDDQLFSFRHSGDWLTAAPTLNAVTINRLELTNIWFRLNRPGFTVNVTDALTIHGKGRLELTDGTITCGSLAITNFGALALHAGPVLSPALTVREDATLAREGFLYVASGPTNGTSPYGVIVSIGGMLQVTNKSWVYPQANPTNGGSIMFALESLSVASDSGFDADVRGYIPAANKGYGPGGGVVNGTSKSGGGYGGTGGRGVNEGTTASATYGVKEAPQEPGSAAGVVNQGGTGGGLIRLAATRDVVLNGKLTANAQGAINPYGTGGAGGGIFVTCRRFSGSGNLSATGGNGGSNATQGGGGGGGGRIAVLRRRDFVNTVTTEVTGGTAKAVGSLGGAADPGEDGTVYWGFLPAPGTLLLLW